MQMEEIDHFHTIAFNHKYLPLEVVGKFHIEEEKQAAILSELKERLEAKELMYLSTCNRVEFFVVGGKEISPEILVDSPFFRLAEEEKLHVRTNVEYHQGRDAVKHLYKVTSSLDSMVIGEREIITQVRKAYEFAESLGLSGELLRLLMRKNIETAKRVFTETAIFRKPVSVVSLAFHRLKNLNVPDNARIVMVGAGKTNKAMAKFLSKHGYSNISIYNRTESKAIELAEQIGAKGYSLDMLGEHRDGFDVLIACTGAEHAVVNADLFHRLMNGENSKKILIDLAIPADIHPAIFEENHAHTHINIEELRVTAETNLRERSKEISKCEAILEDGIREFGKIHRERMVELAMRDIPQKVKEIRETAINAVYAKEIESLNPESKEVLDKVISYLEKKYISVPMKMAREVMLNSNHSA